MFRLNDQGYYVIDNFPGVFAAFSTRKFSTLDAFTQVLNIPTREIVSTEQIHGNRVAIVTVKDKGREIPQVDALITQGVGLPIMVKTADCVPVFLFARERKVSALIHAGYRGTMAGILRVTIGVMKEKLECKPENILAFLGPSIGPCCYEVNRETKEHYDLWEANKKQLVEAGLAEKDIEVSEICTACNLDKFYSYRKEGKKTKRMFAVMQIKP